MASTKGSERILLDHGSGGRISHELTARTLLPVFDNPILAELNDGAIFELEGVRLAFSTDSYTVDPIFFPGGNIGDLAINGTVNDLAMCGAKPLYLSAALIIEEGFPKDDLKEIVKEMGKAAKEAGVKVVTGDTKVVPAGAADKIFINTSGIGVVSDSVDVGCSKARLGDQIILSGSIGDHGVTVLTQREGLALDSTVTSDTAPLNRMVEGMLAVSRNIHVLRDPTRGGVGTALNEIAEKSKVGIRIYEDRVPIKEEVAGICELLGFDPLYLANEGKLLAFVSPDQATAVLEAVRQEKYGEEACIIGEVIPDKTCTVSMMTLIGGERIIDMLAGEQFPRIC